MLKQIKAAIFDLDGTLVDSMWVWETVDIEYMEQYQLKEPKDFYQAIEGMSLKEVAEYYVREFPQLNRTVESVQQEWMDMAYEKYRTEVPLKSGVKEFLQHLRDAGIKIGIATSNARELANVVLEAHGIAEYFDYISSACEAKKGKPAPDVYLKAAEMLQVEPQTCLVFEDVPNGIEAGRRAGMKVCAVEDRFTASLREEKKALADYYINDYFELL